MAYIAVLSKLSRSATITAAKDLGYKVAFASEFVSLDDMLAMDRTVEVDLDDREFSLEMMEKSHSETPIKGLISNEQSYILLGADIAEQLGITYMSHRGALNCVNKIRMRDVLKASGISVVEYGVANSPDEAVTIAERLGYPLVLKPMEGASSVGVRYVSDEEQLRRDVAEFFEDEDRYEDEPLLMEEFVNGIQYTVDAIVYDGKPEVVIVTELVIGGYPSLVSFGYQYPPRLEEAQLESLKSTVVEALGHLGLNFGNAHVEIRWTDAGPKIIEVNPRAPGGRIRETAYVITGEDLISSGVAAVMGDRAPKSEPLAKFARVRDFVADQKGRVLFNTDFDHIHPNVYKDDPKKMVEFPMLEINATNGEEVLPVGEEVRVLGRLMVFGQTEEETEAKMEAALNKLNFRIEP